MKVYKSKVRKMNWVYVLELENNKYYVGFTGNLKNRIKRHRGKRKSSAWVNKHKFKKIIHLIEVKNKEEGKIKEKETTLNYMKKMGWKNVRGYAWSLVNMKNPPKILMREGI